MRILSRLFGRTPVETRDAAFYGLSPSLGYQYEHGETKPAERLAAVAGCVRLIASSMSTLPPSIVQDGQPARTPPWIRRLNPRQSWPAGISWIVRSVLLDGNAILRLELDGRGAVVGLTPVPWSWLNPQLVTTGGETRLVYEVWPRHPEAEFLGLPRRLLDSDVLHIRGDSEAGIIGRSVLSRARGPVREGHEMETLAAANWKNGMRPSGLLSVPAYLDDARRKRFQEEWMPAFSGALAAGKTPIIEGGWSYQQLSMNSQDAEFLASRAWNAEQIASLFGVPPVLLHMGDRLPSDMAPFVTQLAQLALAPLVTAIEAEFATILPNDTALRLDLDGLQRGSFSAVVAALAALMQSGAITANEARAELAWGPIEGGDVLRPGSAPSWPADFKGGDHLGPSPGPTGVGGLAEPGSNQGGGSA